MWGDDRALCDGRKARVSPRTRGFHTSQSEPVPEPVHPFLTCIKVLGVAHFRGAPASVTCFRGPLLKSSSELNAFWNMLPSGRTRALFPSPAHRPNALPPGALTPAVAGTPAARRVTAAPARIPRPPSQPHAQACSLLRPVTSAGDARLPSSSREHSPSPRGSPFPRLSGVSGSPVSLLLHLGAVTKSSQGDWDTSTSTPGQSI